RSGRRLGRGSILIGALVLSVCAATAGAVRVFTTDSTGTPTACTAPAGTLTVAAAPAATPWLTQLAADYTNQHRTVAGRCVQVTVETLSQDQAQQALRPVPFPGAPTPPDVWIPQSTMSVALTVSTSDPGTTPLGTGMLLALVGVQTRTPTPEVGAAAFRRPDVQQAMIGLSHALQATAQSGDALMARVAKASTVAEVISSVGLVAAYEQDVWKYDRDSPAIVLSAAYPVDGQLAADYPYVVPKGSWIDAADRAAADDFR